MGKVKFTFDTVFTDGGDKVSDAARARKRHTMTQAELDGLRTEAHGEGLKAGQVCAMEAIAAAVQNAAAAVREALSRTRNDIEGLRAESAEIALAAARKLARAALVKFPAQEIERCLRDAMHQAIGEPRIVLRVSPEVAEALAGQIERIAHEEGFEGRVQISADPALRNADCRIEWRGGGAERAESAIETSLGDLFARRFSDTAPVQLMED